MTSIGSFGGLSCKILEERSAQASGKMQNEREKYSRFVMFEKSLIVSFEMDTRPFTSGVAQFALHFLS
jgi:hypothetical protein